eukprot:gnl/TRDRNA2_/TRDRNA2_175475_c3_seq8.p1 gnl/TRDRNA2_/TRDRNA2_175475_c3~~gnl/TRDRNA2_/TRDRNA2_175475_c3_seq8.p1  ORF type:complete len:176 (-),score=29.99 gnl/TRDRNA2_/TRDRNA2_175475_c3_seq8:73-600(-)
MGRSLALRSILKMLDPTPIDNTDGVPQEETAPFLNVSTFMDLVPNLHEAQATRILLAAQEIADRKNRPSVSLTDAMLQIMQTSQQIEGLNDAIMNLLLMNEMGSNLTSHMTQCREPLTKATAPVPQPHLGFGQPKVLVKENDQLREKLKKICLSSTRSQAAKAERLPASSKITNL